MNNRLIYTGLIGYGMAGRIFHAPFIQHVPGFVLSKIKTTTPAFIEHACSIYPDTEIVSTTEAILADPSIDLVFILTPNETHYELAKAALNAGKHVVVDKPFTVTTSEANELITLANTQGKILTVYQNRRWTADFKTLKKVLASGALGDLVEYTACYDRYVPYLRPKKWKEENRAGSGVLYDLGSHLIDQALQLFGMPLEVTANIRYQRDNTRIDDYFMLTLQYADLTVYLHSGMLLRTPGPNFLVHGKKGSFVKYGQDVQEGHLDAGRVPAEKDWGKEPSSQWGTLTTELNGLPVTMTVESEPGSYSDFFVNLRDAIGGNILLAVKPEESRDVIKIIELAVRSAREKRTFPVE